MYFRLIALLNSHAKLPLERKLKIFIGNDIIAKEFRAWLWRALTVFISGFCCLKIMEFVFDFIELAFEKVNLYTLVVPKVLINFSVTKLSISQF